MRILTLLPLVALSAAAFAQQSASTPAGAATPQPFLPGGAAATSVSPPANFGSGTCNITIIESQSVNAGHDQDDEWYLLALSMGLNSTIAPQTTLDSNGFFSSTDVLIVASGIIPLPQNRRQTILDFILAGGNVYIQGEYLVTYESNQTFAWLLANLGSSFTWQATASGDLQPMPVTGVLSTTPNAVTPLSYFWYGAYGVGGTGVTPFLDYQGNNFGWTFLPPSGDAGLIVCTTDQDWVRSNGVAPATGAPALMENILVYLCGTGGGGGGITYACDPAANHSGGVDARIVATGNNASATTVTHLDCVDGPVGQFGYFLVSGTLVDPGVAISNGFLCLGAPAGRYAPAAGSTLNSIGQFDAAGVMQNLAGTSTSGQGFDVPQNLPNPPGGSVTAGATWTFQCWYRDGLRSNFSTAVSVQFQ